MLYVSYEVMRNLATILLFCLLKLCAVFCRAGKEIKGSVWRDFPSNASPNTKVLVKGKINIK